MTAPTIEYQPPAGCARAASPAHGGAWLGIRVAPLVMLLVVLACADETPAPEAPVQTQKPTAEASDASPQRTGNQLQNPGFEIGVEGWGDMQGTPWDGFEVVEEPVHSGQQAARMLISWQPGDREKPISARGAVQEISPSRFPDRLSGWYRVDHWENPSDQTLLYLDVAIVAAGDPRTHDIVIPDDPELHPTLDNFQIRYYMAGLTEVYGPLLNMRPKMAGEGPPELGKWVHFDFPVKADYQELWGAVPANFRYLRVFFEVRWEKKEIGEPLRADIYFDDLFFGFDEPPES